MNLNMMNRAAVLNASNREQLCLMCLYGTIYSTSPKKITQRLDYTYIAPDGLKILNDLHNCAAHSGLRFAVLNLVYLRASHINGCAFCIDAHTRDLLKSGMSQEKVTLLPVWREATELFTEQERV